MGGRIKFGNNGQRHGGNGQRGDNDQSDWGNKNCSPALIIETEQYYGGAGKMAMAGAGDGLEGNRDIPCHADSAFA